MWGLDVPDERSGIICTLDAFLETGQNLLHSIIQGDG